jgi:Universal stress protein UspA and related nucleotide-binding proteins
MRLESVVVGMDFSDAAIAAATWVAEHFAPAATMTLVHVIAPVDQPAFAGHLVPSAREFEGIAREYAETKLRDLPGSLSADTIRREVRVGKPYEEINATVDEIGADLIVVGPHGERPRPRKFLGTTADRIARTSRVPVLVATNPPAGRPHQLLVPVDDSATTSTLLASTRDLANTFDADVTLLHVWSNAAYSHVTSMSYATASNESEAKRDIDREFRDTARQWLEKLARTGLERERVRAEVTYGDPGDETLDIAAAISADLILLGRRGTGLVAPALLGSTVGTVLHGATCPVLVVVEQ